MRRHVKTSRSYDSSARRRQAEANRQAVLKAAHQLFIEHGYADTTVPAIARAAGVSTETVYKAFGPKPALVRALWERGLAGRGPAPAPDRSDRLSATAPDPRTLLDGWANFLMELTPEGSPIVLLIRDAAAHDPDMRALLTEVEQQRRDRMHHNAERLATRGWLKAGLDVDRAADILWTYSSAELYELLVLKSGWPLLAYGEFISTALAAALLDHDLR
ncbi:TetR family transcriptional regulator [Kribbella sp. VKM Ac-2571]|uniref:TetR/AcrR family transcriptional regulator n=1 Tax=Kribbella sp. VKM Ac-2571 TaxID=2512222 RepID=UPI00105CF49E|nr:TetR/AcrR family transcriptional regulator [Kribbella sp. VKM Ac-2571]TDO68388.1 TetR family transcriptional regulator [Kribbella sp. VKM Ac-2571]